MAKTAEKPYDPENPEGCLAATMLSTMARETNTYIIGGSIIEALPDGNYNTCHCFNKSGELVATHRKMHLFNVSIKGGFKFFESDILKSGD